MSNKDKKAPEAHSGIENLNEGLTNFGAKVQQNSKKLGIIVTVIVVVVVAVFGFIFWNNHNNAESAKKYSALAPKATAEAMKANPAAQDSVFNAQMLKGLKELAKNESGKDGGNLANLDLGARYYEEGKYKEAIDCLNAADVNEPIVAANKKILIGDCYVNLKKYAEALPAYDEAIADAVDNPEIAVRAMLKKALVLDEQKKYADALAVYEKIEAEYTQQAQLLEASGLSVKAYAERERARLGK